VAKAALPRSAADTISKRAHFITGRGNTAGVSSIMSLLKKVGLRDRIEQLERLVGRLTLENEFLKKGLQKSLSQSRRNGKSLCNGDASSVISGGVSADEPCKEQFLL